jgi:antitoxin component YwqK of YwqJK toxin-antitoxin module
MGSSPPKSLTNPKIGKISCLQIQDESGNSLNHGKYYEWYLSDKIAVTGEYTWGKKSGRWTEYDEDGKVISQTDYRVGGGD